MNLRQTPTFSKQIKKLHSNQEADLEQAIKDIVQNPLMGDLKKGDLGGVRVYKFKMVNQLTLLAYECNKEAAELVLLALGSHENFYRDLK